jgi:magnesium-transporting ATPase (P-type)
MPSEALSLAFAASVYPPAVAAVIALARGRNVRLRVVLMVVGAYFTVFVVGCLLLLLFGDLHASKNAPRKLGAAAYIVGGVVLMGLAARVRRPRQPKKPKQRKDRSSFDRYLQGKWLVLLLGVILYIVPSPIFIGAVKSIEDTHASTATEIGYLALTMAVMLWVIEIPMLLVIAVPERGTHILEFVNTWFAAHGRTLATIVLAVLGVYLLGVGIVEVI